MSSQSYEPSTPVTNPEVYLAAAVETQIQGVHGPVDEADFQVLDAYYDKLGVALTHPTHNSSNQIMVEVSHSALSIAMGATFPNYFETPIADGGPVMAGKLPGYAHLLNSVAATHALRNIWTEQPALAATLATVSKRPSQDAIAEVKSVLKARIIELSNVVKESDDWLESEPIDDMVSSQVIGNEFIAYACLSGDKATALQAVNGLGLIIQTLATKHPVVKGIPELFARATEKEGGLTELLDALEDDALPIVNLFNTLITLKAAGDTITAMSPMLHQKRIVFADLFSRVNDLPYAKAVQTTGDTVAPQDAQTPELDLSPMELNWEILPPGELVHTAQDIIRDVNATRTSKQEVTIDISRLRVLEEIRDLWGKADCYYAKGSLNRRGDIQRGQEKQADEYILLILQDRDKDGNVTAEHAVAESPIVGPHAMYVFRQDVSEGLTWRQIMSLDKKDARAFGARGVKHMSGDTSQSMGEKACYLLTCAKEEFGKLRFNGNRGCYIPKDVVELKLIDNSEQA